ncbi:MAG: hypothetical protein KJ941_06990 [Bacteroidetes bacterium]|nr:hypothetical protein [Bacteroidota bacterium]
MLQSILRKKLSDEQMANVFINGLLEVIENTFPLVAEMINDDTAFVESPNLQSTDNSDFALIVFAANLNLLESTFEPHHAHEIEVQVITKLAAMNKMPMTALKLKIKEYQSFISKINHPSKNLVYGISKSIFSKYGLHNFQDEYFRRLAAPNPLFLKRLDEVSKLFIWDWDAFFKKYKL